MVLELVANKHGMKVFPLNCITDALKLQDAILSATLNDRDYIILERESATSDVINDARFQEMLDLMDGNGIQVAHEIDGTYVRFSKDEIMMAAIEDITLKWM